MAGVLMRRTRGSASTNRRSITIVLVALAALGAFVYGFEFLVSDSATRVAYAVRSATARLKVSRSESLVFSVAWRSWPDGCPGGYRVTWTADGDTNAGLSVDCTTSRRAYSTTYYRNFVTVPRTLQATKEKGEPMTIALRKAANGTIEVIALQ